MRHFRYKSCDFSFFATSIIQIIFPPCCQWNRIKKCSAAVLQQSIWISIITMRSITSLRSNISRQHRTWKRSGNSRSVCVYLGLRFLFPGDHRLVGIALFEDPSAEQKDRIGCPQREEDGAGDDGIGQRLARKAKQKQIGRASCRERV